jgi:predicted CXXCH cytochrome family protein
MKTTKQLILTLLLGLFATFAFAQTMVGTAHDFSTSGWATETCVVCHIAHNSENSTAAPLWNRADPTISLAVYTPYSSTTFDADDQTGDGTTTAFANEAWASYLNEGLTSAEGGIWTPGGSSILCLSCHDGLGNLDAFGGVSGGTYTIADGLPANRVSAIAQRNNGNNEHPFSFTYSSDLVTRDTGLKAFDDLGVAAVLYGGAGGSVECTSCHDVHNAADQPKLLVMTNAGSLLCRTCHTK